MIVFSGHSEVGCPDRVGFPLSILIINPSLLSESTGFASAICLGFPHPDSMSESEAFNRSHGYKSGCGYRNLMGKTSWSSFEMRRPLGTVLYQLKWGSLDSRRNFVKRMVCIISILACKRVFQLLARIIRNYQISSLKVDSELPAINARRLRCLIRNLDDNLADLLSRFQPPISLTVFRERIHPINNRPNLVPHHRRKHCLEIQPGTNR